MAIGQSTAEYISALGDIANLGLRLSVTRIQNARSETMELWLEPWGARLLVPPNVYYDVVTVGRAREPVGDLWQGDIPTLEVGANEVILTVENGIEQIAIFHDGIWIAGH